MNISVTQDGTRATLVPVGKLTVATSPELEAAIAALPAETSDFIIDLAGVEYISSAGLRVLVGTQKTATLRGGSLRLLRPNDEVMEVFEMTGLASVFDIKA